MCRAIADKGWPDTYVKCDFTDGMRLLEGFCFQKVGGSEPLGDALGWPLQGTQFRPTVVTGALQGSAHWEECEAYVAKRYLGWFDFAPLEAITGVMEKMWANEVRGGRWNFQGYNPNFVYRYRIAPELTPSQIVEVCLLYLDRARQVLNTNGRPSTPLVNDKHNVASKE